MAHQRCMPHSLCRANDARSQQSRKVVLIFASGKKEKRNCNHSCHLSYSDLWPYLCGEGSENLIIVKPECSLRCVSSCRRNPEILHSPFSRRNLNPADQEKWDCKDPQEGSVIITLTRWIGKFWWTSSLSECSPLSSSCAWNSGFTFLDEKSQSSWPSTMHASQFVHDSGYKTVLTIKKNAVCLWQQRTLSDCNHSEVSFDLLTRICDHTVHHCAAWSKTDRRHSFSLLLVQGS
jgi:hypothetical protein